MPSPKLDILARVVEPLDGELADRLEHPVARLPVFLAPAEEALVDERLERVGVGIAHDLGGLVVAAAGEDGECSEEPLLFRIQKVVRPLDRRTERLLPRVGVAARLEQVEPLRESIDELLRREDDGSCSGELERQREVVQS